jgi:hypothetical protein
MPTYDTPHPAAHVREKRLPRLARPGDAQHRLHRLECLTRPQPPARILAEHDPAILSERPARRVRKGHEAIVVEIDRKALLAIAHLAIGLIVSQPDVQQAYLAISHIDHLDGLVQRRVGGAPAVAHMRGDRLIFCA